LPKSTLKIEISLSLGFCGVQTLGYYMGPTIEKLSVKAKPLVDP